MTVTARLDEERSLLPEVLKFSVPLMLTGILQIFYNTADSIVVGKVCGSISLAAVGSTGSLVFLIISLFNGCSIGANYVSARTYGAKQTDMLSSVWQNSMVLGLILGLLAGIAGFIFSGPMLVYMNTDPEVLPYATLYLKIYFIGIPAMVVYNFGAALLRSVNDTTTPMVFMLITGAVNVVLNVVLVVCFDLDVAGVGAATAFSQILSAVLVIIRLATFKGPCKFTLKNMRLDGAILREVLEVGLTAGLQGVAFSVANVLIQSQINTFRAAAMAGNSAASSLENFIHTALNSFYQAAITITSQSLGAKKARRAKAVYRVSMFYTVTFGLALTVLLILFEEPFLSCYVKSSDENYAEVIRYGCIRVACISVFQWVGGLMETASGAVRGYGHSMNSTVTTLVGCCILRVVWVYTIFTYFGTIESLYYAFPVSWILTFIIHDLYLRKYMREAERTCAEPSTTVSV